MRPEQRHDGQQPVTQGTWCTRVSLRQRCDWSPSVSTCRVALLLTTDWLSYRRCCSTPHFFLRSSDSPPAFSCFPRRNSRSNSGRNSPLPPLVEGKKNLRVDRIRLKTTFPFLQRTGDVISHFHVEKISLLVAGEAADDDPAFFF